MVTVLLSSLYLDAHVVDESDLQRKLISLLPDVTIFSSFAINTISFFPFFQFPVRISFFVS
jgi:hypothetical protein